MTFAWTLLGTCLTAMSLILLVFAAAFVVTNRAVSDAIAVVIVGHFVGKFLRKKLGE